MGFQQLDAQLPRTVLPLLQIDLYSSLLDTLPIVELLYCQVVPTPVLQNCPNCAAATLKNLELKASCHGRAEFGPSISLVYSVPFKSQHDPRRIRYMPFILFIMDCNYGFFIVVMYLHCRAGVQ